MTKNKGTGDGAKAPRNFYMRYYCLIIAIVLADQLVKLTVIGGMVLGQSIPIIDGIFSITYIQNTGAAFSILEGKTGFLIALPLLVTLLLLVYITWKKDKEPPALLTALCLIIAGGIGNVIDRIRLGYVIDMFDLQVWPIFNVADIAVCSGCVLLMLYLLVLEPRAKKRNDSAGKASEAEERV